MTATLSHAGRRPMWTRLCQRLWQQGRSGVPARERGNIRRWMNEGLGRVVTHREDQTATRPLALGYIRAHILMTDTELADAKSDLTDFARREGYALGTVYVERLDRSPAAYQSLMARVQRDEAAAVIVPGVHHLAVHGSPVRASP